MCLITSSVTLESTHQEVSIILLLWQNQFVTQTTVDSVSIVRLLMSYTINIIQGNHLGLWFNTIDPWVWRIVLVKNLIRTLKRLFIQYLTFRLYADVFAIHFSSICYIFYSLNYLSLIFVFQPCLSCCLSVTMSQV